MERRETQVHSSSSYEEEMKHNEVRILPPVGMELFFAGQNPEGNLPLEIVSDPRLIEQAAFRRNLYGQFTHIFEAIPDPNMNIEQATQEGYIFKSNAGELWDGISDFLEQDENNARILLYLPFEILPNLGSQSQDEVLTASGQRLGDLYWQGWIRLLHETEPRANYVDGDVLEPGLGEPERISKAGHLTPELLAKSIISAHDVVMLLESMTDRTLLQSLAEGATVSNDRGLIDGSDWKRAKAIIDAKVGVIRRIPKKELYFNDPNSNRISPERARWLRKVKDEAREDLAADQLSQEIVAGLSMTEVTNKSDSGRITILGIIKAGEYFVRNAPEQAKKLSVQSEALMRSFWKSDDPAIHDAIVSGLHHWARLGIVEQDFLKKFGITLVDVSSPSQYNDEAFSQEFDFLIEAAQEIKEHPVLSQVLYPSFLLFGSRMKGYADSNADLDAAIFFRPEAKFEARQQILEILQRDTPALANGDKFLEYWTVRVDEKLRFKTQQEDARIFVGEDQIHFFMGGTWIFDGEECMQVRNDMLVRYLDGSRFGDQKEQMRRQLLGQLELDVLQCRLLHKGYRKLYPSNKREGTQNADLIGWNSDFWDPGYRRVATKLFLSRVFLPDLS